MMQLLGGIAVAGVVAAGSTAFTASGVTNSGGFTKIAGGGTTTMTVEGAVLNSAALVYDATDGNKVVGATLNVAGSNGTTLNTTTSVITGTLKGTNNSGTTSSTSALTCTWGSTTIWNCVVGNATTGYMTAVTDLDVKVQPGI
ncbi:hypothetical protein [Actinoplanes missouriensis]|uniref:hypothetical protein n=1 Tax=Actinoplanes missouriensis TaxID=1866 RepID=UPI0012FA3378|nr:hypothetical protein [Actinoplanes missouriensis]